MARTNEHGKEYAGSVKSTYMKRKVKVKEKFGNRNALTSGRHVH